MSATVTTAVRSVVSPSQAVSEAASPWPAAEGHDRRLGVGGRPGHVPAPPGTVSGAHSRPRSRWAVSASSPAARSRAAISSDIATLRCLPPVQPIATVMNRLPSRR